MNKGKIVKVVGPVVDVEFPETIPGIYNALTVEGKVQGQPAKVTLEVQQHLGDKSVRAISMSGTEGLKRGFEVTDSGGPISMPVGEIKGLKIPGAEAEEKLPVDTRESIFEPSPEVLLAYLLSHYLNIYIYQVLLNAKASEQSARMVSMKNATDNADDLIQHLTLEYNNLRQGNITKELLEIAGGQSD